MKTIKYEQFHPVWDETKTKQVIKAYISIYAEGPWHEFKKCSICGEYWGIKDKENLSQNNFYHCNVKLKPFWEENVVKFDLHKAMEDNGSAYIALNNGNVIGFCWGYQTTISGLEKKLEIKIPTSDLGINSSSLIAYQNDLGLLSEYRGTYKNQKIAKELVRLRLIDFIKKGFEFGIVRTRKFPEPSKTYIHYKKLGYKTIVAYPGNDGRVIMFRKFNNLLSEF